LTVINLDIFVSDIVAALASYDVIRVERSVSGDTGPWAELTRPPPADSATLLGTATGPFSVNGLTLSFLLDSLPQFDVTFTGVNPLTTAQVNAEIDAAVGAAIASDDANAVRLTSTLLGGASKLEIVGGSAATLLGFTPGDRDIGEEAYIPLVSGQSVYDFNDNDGVGGYFYRVRFYHTVTGLLSLPSAPFEGSAGTQISSAGLSLGSIDLVDPSGVARAGQVISFFSIHQPLTVENFAVAVGHAPVRVTTDNSGHAEVSLVRGLRVRVVFEGTSLIRDIEVPDAATFDILGLVGVAPDIFDIEEQALPAAPRRTI
jgi:hypothetical protein